MTVHAENQKTGLCKSCDDLWPCAEGREIKQMKARARAANALSIGERTKG